MDSYTISFSIFKLKWAKKKLQKIKRLFIFRSTSWNSQEQKATLLLYLLLKLSLLALDWIVILIHNYQSRIVILLIKQTKRTTTNWTYEKSDTKRPTRSNLNELMQSELLGGHPTFWFTQYIEPTSKPQENP